MHKQHPQTAYRKYAVLIGTIYENCDKNGKAAAGENAPAAVPPATMPVVLNFRVKV